MSRHGFGGTQHPQRNTLYTWANKVEDGTPLIQETLWDDIPMRVRGLRLLSLVKLNNYSFNCAITGVKCFAIPPHLYERRNPQMVWVISNEHLLSVRHHRDYFSAPTDGHWPAETMRIPTNSMILVGSKFNLKLGHTPASLKLLFRRHLRDKQYDRTDVLDLNNTFATLRQLWIDFEDSFRIHGKYPWQPQTYEDVTHRAAAQDYLDRINRMDREFFISLTLRSRWEAFDHAVLPIELM